MRVTFPGQTGDTGGFVSNRFRPGFEELEGRVVPTKIFYVNAAAPTDGDGLTAATATRSIQGAVNTILQNFYGVPDPEIRVAAGTYKYDTAHHPLGLPAYQAVVQISNLSVRINGGYNPANWTARTLGASVIDAEDVAGRRGVLIVRRQGNASPTVPIDGPTNVRMDGFTITRGNATPLPYTYVFGGQAYPADPTKATFQQNYYNEAMHANAFGGGMAVEFGTVDLQNDTFLNNKVTGGLGFSEKSRGGSGAGAGLSLNFAAPPPGLTIGGLRKPLQRQEQPFPDGGHVEPRELVPERAR